MRISDWSSDVCSSDLVAMNTEPLPPGPDDDDANAATLPPSLAPRAAIYALMAQPERYGFFQAARLLFRTHGLTDLRAGGREAVRFGVIDSLSLDRKSTRLNSSH